ncbi:unnamed protein product [Brachionus calyciflorus]|uniref:DDE-1 domain-containing protein n=1 Tax=Brachionus calyciflorus TaxID=104777 RepID=A0A814LQA6_9BILA|nr:unnamed protein product [Brachionus calyciflorus]
MGKYTQVYVFKKIRGVCFKGSLSLLSSKLEKKQKSKFNEWFLNGETTKFGNHKSDGYANCIKWLSEIWNDFSSASVLKGFEKCGITSQFDLHSSLKQILKTSVLNSGFIDDLNESDDIEGFSPNDEDIFENAEISSNLAQLPSSSSTIITSASYQKIHMKKPQKYLINLI